MEARARELVQYVSCGKNYVADWLASLRDRKGWAAIRKRLDRVEEGLFGDHRPVGDGVQELRIDFGPGYRVYYGEDGPRIVLLLCGGDKSTQDKDIRRAKELWSEYRRSR